MYSIQHIVLLSQVNEKILVWLYFNRLKKQ
jgi:hypothetical protein